MRETLIKLFEKSEKKLNPMEVMNMVNKNGSPEELHELIDELELLCRDGIIRHASGNSYFKNDLLTGIVDYHEKGNAHIIIPDHEDVFISRDMMRCACDKDLVAVVPNEEVPGTWKISKILKRSLGRAIGEVIDRDGRYYIESIDEKLPYKIEVDLENTNINLVDGLYVHLEYIKDIDPKTVKARIDYPIGHKNAVGNTTAFALIGSEFGRRSVFPEEVLEEAKKFKTYEPEEVVNKAIKEGRVDLRGETIVTIDGKDTKDIDDAINTIILPNGNFKENTSIADVSDKVKMGSAIWKYAEEKGNSDYWGNKVAPMLPIELSNGICSLNPNEDRFAVSVEYELDHSGKIINPNVFISVIRSKQKMNYDAVQDIELLQKLLGHKNISTTQIYAQVRDERVAEMQNKITAGLISI